MRGRLLGLAAATLLAACAPRYVGRSRPIDPIVTATPTWDRAPNVVAHRQRAMNDCGVAAAATVVSRWRGAEAAEALMAGERAPRHGLRARAIRDLLRARGLKAFVIAGTFADLEHELEAGRPVIIGTVKPVDGRRAIAHYEVVVAIEPERRVVMTHDPSLGWRQMSYDDLEREWKASKRTTIVALPATTTSDATVSAEAGPSRRPSVPR